MIHLLSFNYKPRNTLLVRSKPTNPCLQKASYSIINSHGVNPFPDKASSLYNPTWALQDYSSPNNMPKPSNSPVISSCGINGRVDVRLIFVSYRKCSRRVRGGKGCAIARQSWQKGRSRKTGKSLARRQRTVDSEMDL